MTLTHEQRQSVFGVVLVAAACALIWAVVAIAQPSAPAASGAETSWPQAVVVPDIDDDPAPAATCAAVRAIAFVDTSMNGRRDLGEVGLAGVSVRVFGTDDLLLAEAQTDVAGRADVALGRIGPVRVELDPPADSFGLGPAGMDNAGRAVFPVKPHCEARVGFVPGLLADDGSTSPDALMTPQLSVQGVDPAAGAAGRGDVGLADVLLPEEREAIADAVPAIELGDRIWHDRDGDGRQDPGEPGLGGVVVTIVDAAGRQHGLAVTDGDGRYRFGGLLPHSRYRIEVAAETLPDGWSLSPLRVGDRLADSDAETGSETDVVRIDVTTGWVGASGFDFDIGIVVDR